MSHINRRHFLGATAAASAAAVGGFGRLAEAAGVSLTPGVPEGVASYATMGTLPGKKPLIQLTDRPPNYEAPIEYLRHANHAERPLLSCAITWRTSRISKPKVTRLQSAATAPTVVPKSRWTI